MVFSVQQGEHGPLVVYKLKLPPPADTASPAPQEPVVIPAPDAKLSGTPATTPRLAPLEPTILGTVVMPKARVLTLIPPPAAPEAPGASAPVQLSLPEILSAARIVSEYQGGDEAMINNETGETLTLQDVNDAVLWRRETAEKRRQLPVGPRF